MTRPLLDDLPEHRRVEVAAAVVRRLAELLEEVRVDGVRATTRLEFVELPDGGQQLWLAGAVADVLAAEVERLVEAYSEAIS